MDFMNAFKSMELKRTELSGKGARKEFDDTNEKENTLQNPITAIRVRSGDILDGIGVVRGSDSQLFHGNTTGGEEQIISLASVGVKKITGDIGIGYYGEALSNIKIETTDGKVYGPFGKRRSNRHFELELPEAAVLVGFYGNADKWAVESLGMIYCEMEAGLMKDIQKRFGM